MKVKILVFSVALAFTLSALISSCGKKDEQQTTDQIQQNQQQQTTQPPVTQKKDSAGVTDKQKEEQKKKEEEKKKKEELEKKKKEEEKNNDEEKKKQEENKEKQEDPNGVDFSAIWPKRCAKCHGLDGKGKLEGVPNLTRSETKNKSLSQLISTITNGKKAETEDGEDMPSFKSKLTPEEIEAAAKYVKNF
jgi:cytochrome c553